MSILDNKFDIDLPRVRDLWDFKTATTFESKTDKPKLKQLWAILGKNYKFQRDSVKVIAQQLWHDCWDVRVHQQPMHLNDYVINIFTRHTHYPITFRMYERT